MLTRDSAAWWLVLFGALIAYLISAQIPPWQWTYMQCLQFLAAFVAWLVGYLRSSPLAGTNTPNRDATTTLGGLLRVYNKKE